MRISYKGFAALRCLAILVQYQDVKFTLDNPRELFSRMLSEEGFSVDLVPPPRRSTS